MTLTRSLTLAAAASMILAAGNASGQDYGYDYNSYPSSSPYYSQLFSAEELDNLVAPIALYPDPILAQVFIAATFADQVELAARHVRMFGTRDIDYQPWDVSVKAVAHYPPVLNMLADRQDWAAALGQAYAYQSRDLMDAVQRLRWMAQSQGNLVSTDYHNVIIERPYIRIVPAHPRVIYVPVYDPYAIYYRRASFSIGINTRYWSFGVSFPIGSWLNYDCDWLGRRVYYDGWSGGGYGWRRASRPFIQIVNVYVNPRYSVVNINRTIINHTVNQVNLNTYNTVHRNVRFDGYARNVTRVAKAVEVENARGGRAMGRGANAQQVQSRTIPDGGSTVQQSGQRTAVPSGRAQPVQRQQQSPVIERQQSPVIERQQGNGRGAQATQNGGSAQTTQNGRAAQGAQNGRSAQGAQGGQVQSGQRTAIPNGNGRGQSAQRQVPQVEQRQVPQVQQRELPQVQQRQMPQGQQRQAPQVQQRQIPQGQQRQVPQVQQRQAPPQVQQRQIPQVQQRQAPQVQQQRSAPQVQQQRQAPQVQQQRTAQQRSAPQQQSAPSVSRGGGGGGQDAQRTSNGNGQAKGRGRG